MQVDFVTDHVCNLQAAVYGCGCWAEPGRGDSPSVAVTASGEWFLYLRFLYNMYHIHNARNGEYRYTSNQMNRIYLPIQ